MAHNYRNAKRGEETCAGCQSSKVRAVSGRLECPVQNNYQVGRKTICDAWASPAPGCKG